MAKVFLGLGTNMGDKDRNLTAAISQIEIMVGSVLRQSKFYSSQPWGFQSENEFQNAVLLVETELEPLGLLARTQEIETMLGRTEKTSQGYADRIIDIDILLYEDLVMNEPSLKIPHPLIVERDFVLIPLLEIAPNIIHPALHQPFSNFI